MDPIVSLQIVERELAKLRFYGTDQNPHGIRDLLTSALAKLTRERAAAEALLKAAEDIHGKAHPRARVVEGPALDCIVDKPLVDVLGPIITRYKAVR